MTCRRSLCCTRHTLAAAASAWYPHRLLPLRAPIQRGLLCATKRQHPRTFDAIARSSVFEGEVRKVMNREIRVTKAGIMIAAPHRQPRCSTMPTHLSMLSLTPRHARNIQLGRRRRAAPIRATVLATGYARGTGGTGGRAQPLLLQHNGAKVPQSTICHRQLAPGCVLFSRLRPDCVIPVRAPLRIRKQKILI